MLFDEPTLRKLSHLTLVANRVRAGAIKGERRSIKRGSSIEFADYRDYTPGDDLRRLDWNVYARLDRPFTRLFEEQEDLAVTVLVDASGSMDWGAGAHNKFDWARRLAGALGAIALAAGDHLAIYFLQDGALAARFGPTRGSYSTLRMLQFLAGAQAGGQTDLHRALREAALASSRAGLTFLISDLLTESDTGAAGGGVAGLGELQSRGHDAALIHLLAPDELDPPLAGDLRLRDRETGALQEVSLDGGLRTLYRERLAGWQHELATRSRKRNIRYLAVTTARPWEKFVLQEMRKGALIR